MNFSSFQTEISNNNRVKLVLKREKQTEWGKTDTSWWSEKVFGEKPLRHVKIKTSQTSEYILKKSLNNPSLTGNVNDSFPDNVCKIKESSF